MTRPMMQNPKRPAMEACICCGMAPPVSSAVCDVVVLGVVVGEVAVIKGANEVLGCCTMQHKSFTLKMPWRQSNMIRGTYWLR